MLGAVEMILSGVLWSIIVFPEESFTTVGPAYAGIENKRRARMNRHVASEALNIFMFSPLYASHNHPKKNILSLHEKLRILCIPEPLLRRSVGNECRQVS
jgi:hypothetical protein